MFSRTNQLVFVYHQSLKIGESVVCECVQPQHAGSPTEICEIIREKTTTKVAIL